MSKKAPDQQKSGRMRQLNIIYFLDSTRTRSFSIPLPRLNFILVVLALIMGWSVCSSVLLWHIVKDRQILSERLRDALGTIFEYESRYDGVYEMAYPVMNENYVQNDSYERGSGEADLLSGKSADVAGAAVVLSLKGAKSSEESSEDAAANDVASNQRRSDSSTSDLSGIVVHNTAVEVVDSELILDFDIINKKSPQRIEGSLWAVAEFLRDDKQVEFIGAPKSIQVNDKGEPTFPQHSPKFGIRHYARKKFIFPIAEGLSGRFVGVRIGALDVSGEETRIYHVPVDIKIKASRGEGVTSSRGPGPKPG